MPSSRRLLPVFALLAAPTTTWAGDVRLHVTARGAVTADATMTHAIDGAHFCSAAPDPWTAPDLRDPRATPFPFYRLVFGQDGAEDAPAAPGPSLDLALSNYFAATRDHSDPINDSIEIVIAGRDFVGHAGLRDPGFRFAVSYRDDGAGGGFVARHLHEMAPGTGTLDVEGTWDCPPVAADLPEQAVGVHTLFGGAVPARPDPTPLRLARSDIPCLDRGCAGWRVTDEQTGAAYLARVDFTRLRLARALRRQAEHGEVALLIGADVRRGEPPRVTALVLDGVAPAAGPPDAPPPAPPGRVADLHRGGFPFAYLHDLIRRVWGKRAESERHLAD